MGDKVKKLKHNMSVVSSSKKYSRQ